MSRDIDRRAALFGAVMAAGVTAVPAMVRAASVSANDARLVAIAAELLAIDTLAGATHEDAPGYDDLIDSYTPLEEEMTNLPADTLAGVIAKVRASRVPAVAGCVNGIEASLLDDLVRLHGAEALS